MNGCSIDYQLYSTVNMCCNKFAYFQRVVGWSELDNKDHLSWAGLSWAWQYNDFCQPKTMHTSGVICSTKYPHNFDWMEPKACQDWKLFLLLDAGQPKPSAVLVIFVPLSCLLCKKPTIYHVTASDLSKQQSGVVGRILYLTKIIR